jgi:3-hydroxyisobutyrate dehydrogenase
MVDLMAKDLGLAMDVAAAAGVDNRMGQLAAELYAAHQAAGNGSRDFSSVLERYRR